MQTKLTLSINKEVIQKAKKYARASDRSLSKLVESYFIRISSKEYKMGDSDLDALYGIIRLPEDDQQAENPEHNNHEILI